VGSHADVTRVTRYSKDATPSAPGSTTEGAHRGGGEARQGEGEDAPVGDESGTPSEATEDENPEAAAERLRREARLKLIDELMVNQERFNGTQLIDLEGTVLPFNSTA
jgi:hypothetical protein